MTRGERKRPRRTVLLGTGTAVDAPKHALDAPTAPGNDDVGNPSPALLALSEREFQRIVRGALERAGFTVWVVPNMKLTTAGLPDILAWHARLPGLLLALELKTERGRPTVKQAAALAHLGTVPGIESRILRPSGWPALRDVLTLMLKHARR